MNHDMDALIADVGEQLEALVLAADGLGKVAGHAASADRAITAAVAGDGTLTGLELAESVTAYPPQQVADAILATIAAATADAARQRAALLARLSESLT
ncbi:YbaB/EbfC family DNA-binding protein [Nocardia yunnanensis]|uniref:YbaB/EbfC family DNA-binding protein n=1 Tax=Nocardia yunnanensis TaxID=2382165 RepID=A0A386ZM29_9NOCA|nr:YbaB/EbfC family nucleoid-associated protein [Nocardia yunnanensis]AYF78330.1 YbaB/EbfC family DNA-binding protein [Nocardia yunnanensis]